MGAEVKRHVTRRATARVLADLDLALARQRTAEAVDRTLRITAPGFKRCDDPEACGCCDEIGGEIMEPMWRIVAWCAISRGQHPRGEVIEWEGRTFMCQTEADDDDPETLGALATTADHWASNVVGYEIHQHRVVVDEWAGYEIHQIGPQRPDSVSWYLGRGRPRPARAGTVVWIDEL